MAEEKKDRTDIKEFDSDRSCDFCNSQEGKMRKVGQYIVQLSEIDHDGRQKLACQGCKRKLRNIKAHQKGGIGKKLSFLKKIFSLGF